MATYLITGGCGFIGSHLAESLLQDGHRVRILDNLSTGKVENVPMACELVFGDVTDAATVLDCMQGVDGCFHLAAVSSVQLSNEQWAQTHGVNQTGSINVFDAAKKNKTPVVYASSAAVYGDNADMPLRERSEVRPLTAYGADKLGSELHARVASMVHGVPTAGLRFFNIYGPRQDPYSPYSGVISIFVDRVLSGMGLSIYGDGSQTRDFVYVADAVRFLRAAMQHVCVVPAVYNVCTGDSVTIDQLARIVINAAGRQVPVGHLTSRKGDIRTSVGHSGLAKRMLGLETRTRLVQGVHSLLEYAQEQETGYAAPQRCKGA